MARPSWRVDVGREARIDISNVLRWTAANFGPAQARAYADTINAALLALRDGPTIAGSLDRSAVRPGLRALHVARHSRRGRHFILYWAPAHGTINVLRVLHDAMDVE